MTQSTILAAGQSAATSSDIVIGDGATVKVGLFVASGRIPAKAIFKIVQDTPGADTAVYQLSGGDHVTVLTGPGTYRVVRPSLAHLGVDVGVFTEAA